MQASGAAKLPGALLESVATMVGQDACLSAPRQYCRKAPIGGKHTLSCLTFQLTRILTLGNRVVPVCVAIVCVCVCVCQSDWIGD